eukprot:4052939-Pyramimonas_sp.AAC.1
MLASNLKDAQSAFENRGVDENGIDTSLFTEKEMAEYNVWAKAKESDFFFAANGANGNKLAG